MAEDSISATKAVGPYLLQRTLGKGQTGKMAIWCNVTAIAIVKIKLHVYKVQICLLASYVCIRYRLNSGKLI